MTGLLIDNFAGGGGASLGIEAAMGRPIDYAINHDPEAIAMHQVNHPDTKHFCEDVWDVDPLEVVDDRPVDLAWFSPDCTFYSKARGGKPFRDRQRANRRRGLAWLVAKWAKQVAPRVIMLENVEEFAQWGPLTEEGKPCPRRRGMTFRRWVKQIQNLGYRIDMRELSACDYGAPTTRKRLFIIARRDDNPIVFPDPTHGPGKGLIPFGTAADCIDWSIPCPSIFTRKRPLAEATLKRIARGIHRYVVDNPEPFIVTIRGTSESAIRSSASSVEDPIGVVTSGGGHHAPVTPTIVGLDHRSSPTAAWSPSSPLTTITLKARHLLVSAFLAKHYGGNYCGPGVGMNEPMSTVTCQDHHALVQAFLIKYYGTEQNPELREPLGTVTTKDRFGLVMVHGEPHQIVDIGMRMLTPRELFRAQGFPDGYIIDFEHNGKPLTKTAQVRMCGNSVSPRVADALVRANLIEHHEPSSWSLSAGYGHGVSHG